MDMAKIGQARVVGDDARLMERGCKRATDKQETEPMTLLECGRTWHAASRCCCYTNDMH
jgi:hypothetical protein